MKKKVKRKLNACLVIALSSSMTFTSVAAPLTADSGFRFVALDSMVFDAAEDYHLASSSNAKKAAEAEFPEFATDEFWEWYQDAAKKEKRKWLTFIKADEELEDSGDYPVFNLEDEEFLEWYIENCLLNYDEESLLNEFNYEFILSYLLNVDTNSAIDMLDLVYNVLNANTIILSAIGNLWPETYGTRADFLNHGSGTEADPYILDSVDDLRGLALYVAMGQDDVTVPTKMGNLSHILSREKVTIENQI